MVAPTSKEKIQSEGNPVVRLPEQPLDRRSFQEFFLTLAFGWIPRPVGSRVRNFLYQPILREIGRRLYISRNVELIGTQNIFLGDRVSLARQVQIDANTTNALVKLNAGVSLDRGVDIRTVMGFEGCRIELGAYTYIGPYSCLAGPGNISIGKDCLIASHCDLYANTHAFRDPDCLIRKQGLTFKGITIGDNCWLGAGVKVLDGVTIGDGCVVGAGAVVTKDLPANSVAVGVPAKVISQRF
ncbi:MAG: acyltransferase [Synechococcales cyanobacterium RM1_1_8]|nr:acyltransferase [Synechococcales cyanobacterium RM1_1_8]